MKKCFWFLGLITLAFFVAMVPVGSMVYADTLVYQPGPTLGKDAYAKIASDGSGSVVNSNRLRIGEDNNYQFMSYIDFNLAGLPKQASKVLLKMVRVSETNIVSSTNPFEIFLIKGSWTESSVPTELYPGISTVTCPPPWYWAAYDITSVYNSKQSGSLLNGLFMYPSTDDISQIIFLTSDYSDYLYRPKLEITYTPTTVKFSFPLKSSGVNMSPYTTECVSVMDHDKTTNQQVVSYNGQLGKGSYATVGGVKGYKRDTNTPFVLPLLNYNDEWGSTATDDYLFYDNHKGYDYPQNLDTPIYATADGFFAVGVNETSPRSSDGLWRNKNVCYDVTGGASGQWDAEHACYIVHQGGYTTWYLHLNRLDSTVLSQIKSDGFAKVLRGQRIGYVGTWGPTGNGHYGAHLHLGFKQGGSNGLLFDPYGNGTVSTSSSNIKWDKLP